MNVRARNPWSVVDSLWIHRAVIAQLVQREIAGRYRGSFLGLLWAFLNPLLMLSIYTFVFGLVFKSRWHTGSESSMEYAVLMFAGVMLHGLISECITRAPMLIVGNANFVKKVVFPLEALPWVHMGAALFHLLISAGIFLLAIVVWQGHVGWTALWLPVILFPFVVLTVGLVWLVSALGVYLRDIGQLMGLVSSLLMFLAPIFYPLHAAPEAIAKFLYLNPITFVVEQVRNACVLDTPVDWVGWGAYCAVAYVVAWAGLACFQQMRDGFADVL